MEESKEYNSDSEETLMSVNSPHSTSSRDQLRSLLEDQKSVDLNHPPRFQVALPPQQSKSTFRPITLCSNYFKLGINEVLNKKNIVIFGVNITPELGFDNILMKRAVIRKAREQIQDKIGYFLYLGSSIIAFKQEKDIISEVFEVVSDQVLYELTLSRASQYNLLDSINDPTKTSERQTILLFFNVIIKEMMRSMGYLTYGRNNKYFKREPIKVEYYDLYVWSGFKTSVEITNRGLLLEVDYATRVIRANTLLSYFMQVRTECGGDIELVQHTILARFKSQTFIANYGNKKTYQIDDIIFTKTPLTQMFKWRGSNINLAEYFEQQYKIKIMETNQPIVINYEKSINKNIEHKPRFFLPELCLLTGLSEEMRKDGELMKNLARYTKLSPEQRAEKSIKFIQSFREEQLSIGGARKEEQPTNIMRNIGIEIEQSPIEIQGVRLPPVELLVNPNTSIKTDSLKGTFNLREKMNQPSSFQNWILAYWSKDYQLAGQLIDILQRTGKENGLQFAEPNWAEYETPQFEHILLKLKSHPFPDIVLIVLPDFAAVEYKGLKEKLEEDRIISQMVLSSTLRKQHNQSIISKIGIQMHVKMGGSPWIFRPRTDLYPTYTMVVGINITKEGSERVLGFVSSTKIYFEEYCTQTELLKADLSDLEITLKKCICYSIEKFKERVSEYPQYILIYRDGLAGTQEMNKALSEIECLELAISTIYRGYKPSLTYCRVNQMVCKRYFQKVSWQQRGSSGRGGLNNNKIMEKLENAPAGTAVLKDIVSPSQYEFLLMPHYVNQGSGTPTEFTVLYCRGTERQSKEQLLELTNCFCNVYYNWMGPIRVPAVIKCACLAAKKRAKYNIIGNYCQLQLHYL